MIAQTYIFTIEVALGVIAALATLCAAAVFILLCVNIVRRAFYFKPGEPHRWRNIIVYAWGDIFR